MNLDKGSAPKILFMGGSVNIHPLFIRSQQQTKFRVHQSSLGGTNEFIEYG